MNKKKIIIMSALLLVLVAVVIGITYAVYTFTGNSGLNTIDLGRISMSYTEPSNSYVLDNALPMTDEEGKGQNNYFEFTVTSHATTKESDSTGITIPYEINISDIAIDEGMLELSKSLMKVNLVKVDGMTENEVVVPTLMSQLSASSTNDGAMVVYQTEDVHKNGSTAITSKYRLRAWITPEFDASNTDNTYQYKFRVNVNSNMDGANSNQSETKLLRTAIMDQGVVNSGDGLYVSTETNDGLPTYYYRGNVENNYVKFGQYGACSYNGVPVIDFDTFIGVSSEEQCEQITNLCDATSDYGSYGAGVSEELCTGLTYQYITATPTWDTIDMSWRVVRINEDQTIRLINTDMSVSSAFYPIDNDYQYKYMYYSESNVEGGVMKALNDWYSTYLTDYDSQIATSTFCEQAKVTAGEEHYAGNVKMIPYEDYISTFRCGADANGYGLISDQKIGLITIDELIHAGVPNPHISDVLSYLETISTWTMSPSKFFSDDDIRIHDIKVWKGNYDHYVDMTDSVAPIINLNADVLVTGNGTSISPWVVTK